MDVAMHSLLDSVQESLNFRSLSLGHDAHRSIFLVSHDEAIHLETLGCLEGSHAEPTP